MKFTVEIAEILFEQVDTTYYGADGCACGCRGKYVSAKKNPVTARKRLAFVNHNLHKAHFFGNGVEVANSDTRVTRVYFVDGITRYN